MDISSLPQLLVSVGECDEGQEDQSSDAANEQAQQASVHMHGLTALPCVEKGMPRDAPAAGHSLYVHTGAFILARVWVTWVSEVLWPVVVLHGTSIFH